MFKKLLTFLFIVFSITSCLPSLKLDDGSYFSRYTLFKKKAEKEVKTFNASKLKIGDIIVKEADGEVICFSWVGHVMLLVSKTEIIDCTAPPDILEMGEKIILGSKGPVTISNLDYFMNSKYNFKVLRLKDSALEGKGRDEFYATISEVANETLEKGYFVSSKSDTGSFYCSQLIYYIYKETGRRLGKDWQIDGAKFLLISPYEILCSDILELKEIY